MSWLTKFLGFDEIIVAKDGEIINLYTQLHRKDEQLRLKDIEIQRLTNLMLTEHGIILRDSVQSRQVGEPKALNKRSSWPQKQKEYEKVDKEFAKDQVGALRDYWTKKDKEAESELQ